MLDMKFMVPWRQRVIAVFAPSHGKPLLEENFINASVGTGSDLLNVAARTPVTVPLVGSPALQVKTSR